MKSSGLLFLASVSALFVCATPLKSLYRLASDYEVTIHGTSNLHSWEEAVTTVTGNAALNANGDSSFNLNALNIKMDVHSIKSDMGSMMNNNTYKALKADANPNIIFMLSTPVKFDQAGPAEKTISVKGSLSIAGVTRAVDMLVKVTMQQPGKLSFEGSQAVKMTDYGVSPPTALLGTLKTGNEIIIHFKTNFTLTNDNK